MEISPQCYVCKHYAKRGDCPAFPFPLEIPLEIVLNDHDHRKAFKGDQGITWEPIILDGKPAIHPIDN
jgi:hypothetical protein